MPAAHSVSVVIPAYNARRFVGEALESVLAQGDPLRDVTVCDDCSSDGTEEMIRGLDDSRIGYFRNGRNLGPARNFNECVKRATGKYVCLFHADDVMLSGNLAKKVELLEENPAVGMVHSNAIEIDGKDHEKGAYWGEQGKDWIRSGKEVFSALFLGDNTILAPSVVVRTECYERLGLFDTRLRHCQDLEMWLRICAAYDVAYFAEPLIKYRVHAGQDTARYSDVQRQREDYLSRKYALGKSEPALPGAHKLASQLRNKYGIRALNAAYRAAESGDKATARRLLSLSARIDPCRMASVDALRLMAKLLSPVPAEGANNGKERPVKDLARRGAGTE